LRYGVLWYVDDLESVIAAAHIEGSFGEPNVVVDLIADLTWEGKEVQVWGYLVLHYTFLWYVLLRYDQWLMNRSGSNGIWLEVAVNCAAKSEVLN
jgi:hypothetical protein